ncbi:histidinol phosphate phosphatase HisJ family protein [Colletotrichum musicola]|uniref:Histidinol-phosphatase n=1 Tax=Colletotrichum musicola TaxID=2175873 RepID=A0A8H6NXK6_9PEZI|nr:histidinol phosphate phosphatase HisJ family protein [Colletotrichum musicola]
MAFTMHSHSGQFCPGHAKDQLEAIIQHAISIGYKTMGLTEHMPRLDTSDLYPEETRKQLEEGDPEKSLAVLAPRHDAYLAEAQRLRAKYASQIDLLIGFEGEWYRPAYGPFIRSLAAHPAVDYFIGSLHHVNAVPIDYSREMYVDAMNTAGGNEESMYERYYDQQHEMLAALEPKVVGHFDLVRLMSEDPGRDVRNWEGVWERIVRNLKVVREYGGLLECNSSALRKGLAEPYPCRVIAEAWLEMGGKFTFSDDSHGIAQVATNYKRNLDYLASLGVEEVYTFERGPVEGVNGHAKAVLRQKGVSLDAFRTAFK